MVSDQGLRDLLVAETEHLANDVDARLDALYARATRRRVGRSAVCVVGIAAIVTVASLLVFRDGPHAREPAPVDQLPLQATTLMPKRGEYADPAVIEPGLHHVSFAGSARTYLQVDVPAGWSQDDDMVLTTGAGDARDTVRMELNGDVEAWWPDPCADRHRRVRSDAAGLASALAEMKRLGTGVPYAASIDGYDGYLVRLEVPDSFDLADCGQGWLRLFRNEGWAKSYAASGWTDLIWVLDVEGQTLLIDACYGPDATQEQIDELVRMVETATFVDP